MLFLGRTISYGHNLRTVVRASSGVSTRQYDGSLFGINSRNSRLQALSLNMSLLQLCLHLWDSRLLTARSIICLSVPTQTLPMVHSGGRRSIPIFMRRARSSISTQGVSLRSTSTSSSTQHNSSSNGARHLRPNLAREILIFFQREPLTSGSTLIPLLTPKLQVSCRLVLYRLRGTLQSGELNDNY